MNTTPNKHIIKSDGPHGEEEDRGVAGRKSLERRLKMKKLFAFVATFIMAVMASSVAMAAEGAAGDSKAAAIAIAAGVAVGIAAFGAALGQGRVGAAAMESIGRNPNAAEKLFLPLVLTLALLEALALYGFVIAILLQGKI
jgi:F-type H+-transporting ATPase subunit c